MSEPYKFSIQNDKYKIEGNKETVFDGYRPVEADKVFFLDGEGAYLKPSAHFFYLKLVLNICSNGGESFTYAFLGCGFGLEVVLNDTHLAVLIGNLFSIVDLTDGSVIALKKLDACFTCFALFLLKDGYIAVTELDVFKLDLSGNVIWRKGGADIFFNHKAENPTAYTLTDEYIELHDFDGSLYRFDLKDGRTIKYEPAQKIE